MRVLLVNTSEKTGGAAVAANRLMEALNNNGVKAKLLVRDKITDNITVVGLKQSIWRQLPFLWERFVVFLHTHLSKHHLFDIDIANQKNTRFQQGCGMDHARYMAGFVHLSLFAWLQLFQVALPPLPTATGRGIRQ